MTDEQRVLERLQKNGTFDDLRRKLATQLRADSGLQASALRLVEHQLHGTDEKSSRKEVFERLCITLEDALVRDALKEADQILHSASSEVSKGLDERVEEALVLLKPQPVE